MFRGQRYESIVAMLQKFKEKGKIPTVLEFLPYIVSAQNISIEIARQCLQDLEAMGKVKVSPNGEIYLRV